MKVHSKISFFKKIRDFAAQHKKALLVVASSLLVVGSLVLFVLAFFRIPASVDGVSASNLNIKINEAKPEPIIYYSKLSGLPVENESSLTKPVTAVMIENSPEARPQSGLKNAEVVFEAIAEGGITRFMALYQNARSDIIGPVRSVRIYYVNWLASFDASVAHAGGSAEALDEVRNGNYRDIDQFFNAGAYWRATDRYAPHNLYTSSDNLDALNASKGYTQSNFSGYTRVDGEPATTLDATNISVGISSYNFNSTYAYEGATNTYKRYQAGEPHLDRESGQIAPSVVIVMHVNEYSMADGHESIENIGSGSATIFQNGTAINVTWTKDSKTSQIKFTDAANEEVPLVRGQLWIVAVPNNSEGVSWS